MARHEKIKVVRNGRNSVMYYPELNKPMNSKWCQHKLYIYIPYRL